MESVDEVEILLSADRYMLADKDEEHNSPLDIFIGLIDAAGLSAAPPRADQPHRITKF